MEKSLTVQIGQDLFIWRCWHTEDSVSSWMKGYIQSVSAVPTGKNWRITAIIQYEDGLRQEVLFSITDGEQVITCPKSGRNLEWRTVGTDAHFFDDGLGTGQGLGRSCAARNGGQYNASVPSSFTGDGFGSPDDTNPIGIETRLQILERCVLRLQTEHKSHMRGCASEVPEIPERALKQLRGKMEIVLERPIQFGVTREDVGMFFERDVLRCAVDCSLGEYKKLCLAIKRDSAVSSVFLPHTVAEQSAASLFASTTVHFLSFQDLCIVLGESEENKLTRALMKTTRRRTRSAPSLTRIIGDIVIPHASASEPLYILVGFSICEETMELCKKPIPVLMRESMERQESDMVYIYELETTLLAPDHARKVPYSGKFEGFYSKTSKNITTKKRNRKSRPPRRGFEIRWTPQRNQRGSVMFEERGRVFQKSGYLELLMPTVFCHSRSQCDELIGICTDDFLRKCIGWN